MLASLTASNSQFIVESFVRVANALPAWVTWNPFSAGVGTDAMLGNATAWWLAAPAIAIVLAVVAVLLAVRLTSNGLACSQDSVRGSKRLIKSTQTSIGRFGIFVWKELLQIRRQPEFAAQVLATPLGIGLMLYVGGYKNVMESATQGGANISLAILIGCSYMLMIAATQMLASEFKTLWLLQCQPRPLADIVRGKSARVGRDLDCSERAVHCGSAGVYPECDCFDSGTRAVSMDLAVVDRGTPVRPDRALGNDHERTDRAFSPQRGAAGDRDQSCFAGDLQPQLVGASRRARNAPHFEYRRS